MYAPEGDNVHPIKQICNKLYFQKEIYEAYLYENYNRLVERITLADLGYTFRGHSAHPDVDVLRSFKAEHPSLFSNRPGATNVMSIVDFCMESNPRNYQ